MSRTRWRHAALFIGVAVSLAGCAKNVRSYEIRHRAFKYDREALATDYREEHGYLREWRRRWCTANCGDADRAGAAAATCGARCEVIPETNTTGISLSGGGIRSATFSLGVLQALEESGVLDRLDYMSAVSGGAYFAGWVQAHLGAEQHGFYDDALHYQVAAKNFRELLDNHGDQVEQLRTHAGFLNRGGWWEGVTLVWAYLWRWPFAFVADIIVHVKGRNNAIHPIDIYVDRLARTYFRGVPPAGIDAPAKDTVKLFECNAHAPASAGGLPSTPYLIINGNLVNRGRRRGGPETGSNFNFEFTRDLTGSDGLGYVPTDAFDLPVAAVEVDSRGTPTSVRVVERRDRSEAFGLSHAVAAAGAAFDPDGLFTNLRNELVRTAAEYVAAPFNLNVGYETYNFARAAGRWGTIYNYVSMLTWERLLQPRTNARWIKVTDGGHFENLGVVSLVRRGVSCIVAIDATADPAFEFGDLYRLQTRLKAVELDLELPEELLAEARTHGRARFTVSQGTRVVSTILYMKPNANPPVPTAGPGKPAPQHMVPGRLAADVGRLLKISAYPRARAERNFPHTSTFQQWYDWETFEAYRLLGYQMGRTYFSGPDQLETCSFVD